MQDPLKRPRHLCRARGRGEAFTLVELLVVIGIIVVLMSLLLPTLARFRETARRQQCLSNVRQCVAGLIVYATDNQGELPPGIRDSASGNIEAHPANVSQVVYQAILKAVGSDRVMVCPDWSTVQWPINFGEHPLIDPPNGWIIAYYYLGGHNAPLDLGQPVWKSPKRVSESGRLPLWCDLVGRNDVPGQFWHTEGPHGRFGFVTKPTAMDAKQFGLQGTNVGYLDGSVQWRDVDELERFRIYYRLSAGGTSYFPPEAYYGYW